MRANNREIEHLHQVSSLAQRSQGIEERFEET
jgi:hypothetical protein